MAFPRSFCMRSGGNGTQARLAGLRRIHEPPTRGRIKVGRSSVTLEGFAIDTLYPRVVLGYRAVERGGRLGYRLGGLSRWDLSDARIVGRLVKVNRRGVPLEVLEPWRSASVARSGAVRRLVTKRLFHLAFYRLDIEISAQYGHRVYRFSEYGRVLQPRLRARLRTDRHRLDAGDSMYIRLDNTGTAKFRAGYTFRVQRRVGFAWRTMVDNSPSSAVSVDLLPGRTIGCLKVETSPEWLPGSYRVIYRLHPEQVHRRLAIATANFHLDPASRAPGSQPFRKGEAQDPVPIM
jgi:hypothetical protein